MTGQVERTLRAGVIGAGVMGRNHARMLSTLPGVVLSDLMEPDAARRAEAANELRCQSHGDFESFLKSELDLVVIASPNETHRELGVALLDAGVHVLVEKPIAPTIADAQALIAAAKANKRQLMVGQIERFNPAVQAAKKACEGEDIIAITIARVGPFPPRMSKIGIIIDLGVHDIDIIRMISGSEIKETQALLSRVHAEREDNALLQFRTENNVIAQINTNWTTPYKHRSMQIATAKKFISADLMTRQVVEYSEYTMDGTFRTRPIPVQSADPLRQELEAFIRCVRTGAAPPISGEDGLRNLEVALQCLQLGSRP
jgi:predicted dehydrogenase